MEEERKDKEQTFVQIEKGVYGDIISDMAKVKSLLLITEKFTEEEMAGEYPLYELWNVLQLANETLEKSISALCDEHPSQQKEKAAE